MSQARQVLYLDGNGAMRVLRDGPSLLIKQTDSADRRVPLRRLLRVVSMGTVEWSCQAMLACADANIVICFTNRCGVLRGTFNAPAAPTNSTAMQLVEDYFNTVNTALDDHRTWVRAWVVRAQLASIKTLGSRPSGLDSKHFAHWLHMQNRRYVRRPDRERFVQRIRGLAHPHVRHLLESVAGIAPDTATLRARSVNLVDDYVSILLWWLYPKQLQYMKRCYRRARSEGAERARLSLEAAPRFYETCHKQMEMKFKAIWQLHQLHLAEELYSHAN